MFLKRKVPMIINTQKPEVVLGRKKKKKVFNFGNMKAEI